MLVRCCDECGRVALSQSLPDGWLPLEISLRFINNENTEVMRSNDLDFCSDRCRQDWLVRYVDYRE